MGKSDELYERLISPIENRMIGIVARIMRDPEDAADVFQEVLALIWAKLARIDRHPNPHAYIIRICITRSYDALRKRARRRRLETRLILNTSQMSLPGNGCPKNGAQVNSLIPRPV
jgi:DNA-directed RNA polymerase specialized sigma24 family protein